jgi:oxygen-independent coproporphyrinogen-3 oxidase
VPLLRLQLACGHPGELPEARYLDALRADLEASLPLVWGRSVHSVFLGGGTPSLFSPEGIARLLSELRTLLPLLPGCEVTLEANPAPSRRPGSGLPRGRRDAPVDRRAELRRRKLKALGRVHDRRQALAAAELAAEVFDTFNLDLMYALPGQDMAGLETDLRTALSFAPPHLSLYHLTLEPNTAFALKPPCCPTRTSARRCWTAWSSSPRPPGWSATKSRPMRGRATAAPTT